MPLRYVHISEPGFIVRDAPLGIYLHAADVLAALDRQGAQALAESIDALIFERSERA